MRALAAYGDTKNVPAFVHGAAVLTAVRDAAEQWDGRAPGRLAEHTDAPWDDYQFGAGGSLLADVLPVDDLVAWAHEVQAHLLQAEREWR